MDKFNNARGELINLGLAQGSEELAERMENLENGADEEDDAQDPFSFVCLDCKGTFDSRGQDGNSCFCSRCEANFIAQVNYDNESGENDRDEDED